MLTNGHCVWNCEMTTGIAILCISFPPTATRSALVKYVRTRVRVHIHRPKPITRPRNKSSLYSLYYNHRGVYSVAVLWAFAYTCRILTYLSPPISQISNFIMWTDHYCNSVCLIFDFGLMTENTFIQTNLVYTFFWYKIDNFLTKYRVNSNSLSGNFNNVSNLFDDHGYCWVFVVHCLQNH